MVRGKAGALDDLMAHKQVSRLRLPYHRNVAHVDHRVLGMRVPLGSKDALPAEGVCPAEGLANRHSLPARRPSHEVHMLYAVAMLASVALVLVNAFFVAAEFAIVKIRPSRLEHLAARGQRRARVALGIAHRLDTYLSANQLGITLASLALGWIGEPAFAGLLKPLFASFGAWSVPTGDARAVMGGF